MHVLTLFRGDTVRRPVSNRSSRRLLPYRDSRHGRADVHRQLDGRSNTGQLPDPRRTAIYRRAPFGKVQSLVRCVAPESQALHPTAEPQGDPERPTWTFPPGSRMHRVHSARSTDDRAVACEQHQANSQNDRQASGSSPLRWEGFLGEQSPRQTGDAL